MKTIVGIALITLLSSYHFALASGDPPASIGPFRVAIEINSSGTDDGMTFNGAIEKEITFAIARAVPDFKPDHTVVLLTNGGNTEASFKELIKDSKHFDLYISLHTSYNKALSSGTSVFYSSKGNHTASSQGYGNYFAKHLTGDAEGAREAQSEVLILDHLKCPSIQIETGNLGAISDFYSLTSEEGQKLMAQKIAKVINDLAYLKYERGLSNQIKAMKPKLDKLFLNPVKKAGGN